MTALLGAGLVACVKAYESDAPPTADVLVVEGAVTDLPGPQTVRLGRSRVEKGQLLTVPIGGATVEIVDGSTAVALRESPTDRGLYAAPEGFRGRVGGTYLLRFQLADGSRYESAPEVLRAVPPIGRVYDRFDEKAIRNAEKTRYIPANLIYVDTQDPANERNFYRWTWTLWERQQWCASCMQGLYYLARDAKSGECVTNRNLPTSNLFEYGCLGSCWEILRGNDINLFADTYTNGRPLLGQVVAQIPFYQSLAALVEIQQVSLTPEAYRYFKLLENQTQNTGSLADTPPAPLIGNVRNLTNGRENVAGYFAASGVASVRYWLDRQNTTGPFLGLFEALNGRPANPEPPSPLRPPLAVCIPGPYRTPVMPEGWRQ